MTPKNIPADNKTRDAAELRQKAEQKLLARKKKDAAASNEADSRRLLHELQVHQIELEMQNEELMQARAESEAALNQYVDLYDFAPVGYFTLARDGRILKTNLAGADLLGALRSDLIERRFGVFVSVKSRPAFSAFLEKRVNNRGSDTCDVALIKNEKESLWVSINAFWFKEKQEFRAVMVDITEHKQAEEALRKSEERARSISNAIPDLVFRLDRQGVYLDYKADVNDLYSQSENIIGRQNRDITPPEFADLIDNQIRTTLESGKTQIFEFQLPIPDKGVRNYDARMVANGPDEVIAFVRDITEQKQMEKALRESEDKFKYLFDHSIIGKSLTDLFGAMEVNNSLAKMLGYSRDELNSHNWRDITHPDDIELNQRALVPLLAGEQDSVRFIKRYIHKNGSIVWADVSTALRRDQGGDPLYYISAVIDITERKRAEEKIRLQNQRLSILREIDTAILAADSLENIVGAALGHIRQLVNCRRAALTLFDEETNEAEIFDVKEDNETSPQKGTRLPLALFQDMGETLSKNQLLLIKELAESPVPPPQFQTLLQSGIHSVCILPSTHKVR